MAYKNNEILALIAKRPGVRTVEIADMIDIDVEMVSKSIQDEIDQGIVKTEEVLAPNGRKTIAYSIRSNHLAKYLAPVAAIVPAAPIAPAPVAAVAVAAQPAAMPAASAGITKVDLAINCVRDNGGRATSAQLHKAMGLRHEQHPTNFLAAPLKNGRLVRINGLWCIGSGSNVPAKPAAKAIQAAPVVAIAPATPAADPVAVIAVPEVAIQVAKEEPAPAVPSSRFACALWSDGELQLARGDVSLAKLSAVETEQLLDYLDRNRDRRAA